MAHDDNSNNNSDELSELDRRLKRARGEPDSDSDSGNGASKETQQGIGFALRVGMELVVALLVGFALGYFLDGALGTRPLFMVLFGFLGLGAGVSNIYRLFNKMDMSVGYRGSEREKNNSEK